VSTLPEESGQPSGQVIVFKDVTSRRQTEQELQESWARLRRALKGTIQAISTTIEMRDPYTAGHQRRVAQLAEAVAREMNLPEVKIEGIRFAAQIHDIGKIYVPAEILSKPTKLTDLEYTIIKTHPQAGYEILKNIEFPWPIAEIVLQHHERLNGSGYPAGLKDGEILLEARILAIADVVEAMSSHRPYRPSFGIDKALDEIRLNNGLLYEPEAVAACQRLFLEKAFSFD
ncbi:MAG TPA: HD-GYP domain-containing protein, partial [Candidatus Saccharicenans sp.]|nr:HD-GYP domain-containing protein [Candidatus Saccharicenans sp.]